MNIVTLIGRLTRDPDLRFTPGTGNALAKFTLAVNRQYKSNNGADNNADFIPITVWGKLAENCANYLHKGSQAAINGTIKTGSYTAQDGSKRYTTEVVAREVTFLDPKNVQRTNTDSASAPQYSQEDTEDAYPVSDDEVPF